MTGCGLEWRKPPAAATGGDLRVGKRLRSIKGLFVKFLLIEKQGSYLGLTAL